MSISPLLMKAIFSMDAYNRGYDASIDLRLKDENGDYIKNSDTNDVQIGNATITASIADDNLAATNIGFYALAYDYNEETVISYRGTDYPETVNRTVPVPTPLGTKDIDVDIYHGWSLGAGNTDSEQAQMAVKFYQAIAGE